ncbi:MAG: hypothetical protein HOP19_08280 [Acidobacteria bacterium]|nr:hypothetical protein [Acidobacteriota bacterium]
MKWFSEIKDLLRLEAKSKNFIVHFGLRNPPTGVGLGAHGVRDRTIIQTYLYALERLYQNLTAAPWSRPRPAVGDAGLIEVYVFDISELAVADGSPFTSITEQGKAYICLPAGSFEPSPQAELHRAAAEAIHEATHVFNHQKRPLGDLQSRPWEWVDEALAVLMEITLIPGNQDHFRFLKNWVEMPEVSLDNWGARYQAGLFAYYLEKKVPGFLNRVWQQAIPEDSPLEAMKRLAPAGEIFLSHLPDETDLFASGYCLDSYFLWDHSNDWCAPELRARFGERAVSESFIIRPGQVERSIDWELDHLACRYFRIALKGEVKRLQIEVQVEARYEAGKISNPPRIKAELAVVTDEMRPGDPIRPLRPSPITKEKELMRLVLEVDVAGLDYDKADHLVLVVSNCGTRTATVKRDVPHDDNRKFCVRVTAT